MEQPQDLKEFSVSLFPKPKTFKVNARTPWEAVKIAEDKYGSGDVTGYGFHKFEIKEAGDDFFKDDFPVVEQEN